MSKIYVSHSTSFDFKKELYEPLKSVGARFSGLELDLPHERSLSPSRSLNEFSQVDLLLLECSFPSTGSGIEIGWANAQKVPVVALHRKQNKVSSAVLPSVVEMFPYTDIADLEKKHSLLYLKNILRLYRCNKMTACRDC